MPRLPFSSLRQHSLTIVCLSAGVLGFAAGEAQALPSAVIQSTGTIGQAPFAVHVHGLNSWLNGGDEGTARFEWDFGDPTGQYNTLVGWNAAHIYNSPGAYLVKLHVINQSGQDSQATILISVGSSTRTTIYVSPSGSDSNSGLLPSAPIQTAAKANSMIGDNKAILFQRGGTFNLNSQINVNSKNVIVGAYGIGSPPKLYYTDPTYYAKIISMDDTSKDVVIENLNFDSPFSPNNLIVRAIHPHGTNITVRNCYFGKISYAMNTGGSGVNGLLTLNNTTGAIGAYYIWAQGNDHTHLGNTVGDSTNEHNIRFGGASRVNISYNNLTNTAKSTIWCMLGDHAYIANNSLHEGRFIAGPNFAISNPSERFTWVVFENNEIFHQGVVLYAGAEHITLRNNVIHFDSGQSFSVWGYDATWDRTCKYISILNNTAMNDSAQYGQFLKLGKDADTVIVANNLYCAPSLNPSWGADNVVSDDSNLDTHSFHHNLWASPINSNVTQQLAIGGQTPDQWASFPETFNEMYRQYHDSDLDAEYVPQFDASLGVPLSGVFRDFYGNLRPADAVAVGAVEVSQSPPTVPPTTTTNTGDVNGDGVVDATDLTILLGNWGTCGNCAGDLNGDGVINGADLAILLGGWH